MELDNIRQSLSDSDLQTRLKAIKALNQYDADVAIPLLKSRLSDPEFLVRSFVAMGLGAKQGPESFAALLEMISLDRDTNVKAEAANSLSLYGQVSIPHLVKAFFQHKNWLVRRSILSAMAEMDCPDSLYDVSLEALNDADLTVQQSGIDTLGLLANTKKHSDALAMLLSQAQSAPPHIRIRVAYALKHFKEVEAQEGLQQLKNDTDHRVAGAVLENLA